MIIECVRRRLSGRAALRLVPLLFGLAPVLGHPAANVAQTEIFNPSPHAIELPRWFTETFLDFRDDIKDAAAQGKRLMSISARTGALIASA